MGAAASIEKHEHEYKTEVNTKNKSETSLVQQPEKYYPNINFPVLHFRNAIGFKEIYNDKGTGAKMDGKLLLTNICEFKFMAYLRYFRVHLEANCPRGILHTWILRQK